MADLLFLNVEQGHRRPRRFRLKHNSIIDGYTDDELRARYRFVRQSILFITNLLTIDLQFSSFPSGILRILSLPRNVNFSTFRRGNFLPTLFYFLLVTLFVSLLRKTLNFSSTLSVEMAISDKLKFCFLAYA